MVIYGHNWSEAMRSYSVAEAKAKLSELLSAVEAGEDVRITRHGKPVVRVVRDTTQSASKFVDMDALRKIRESMPYRDASAVDLLRSERDSGRY
jgi:prevent-host-death family protein